MSQSKVLIIYTGGTIGMVENPETGSLKPFDFDHLSNEIPELKKFNCELTTHSFAKPIDSSNMHPDVWIELAQLIGDNYDDYDGFVILHGSDTMAYTASALSFMLENLSKSVILTGAQLPIGTIRTDGKENLITAIEVAAARKNGKALVPEVAIYFEYNLYRGNRTKKVDSEDFEAFQSLNYPLLAEAGVNLKYHTHSIRNVQSKDLKLHLGLNTNIAILKLFPGIGPATVKAILEISEVKAIVLETYGSGNAPTESWFIDLLESAIARDIIIMNVTQCQGGSVNQGKYETSLALAKIGVVSGKDCTTEAAVTKLMHLLGRDLKIEEVKKLLSENLRGEITLD